MKIVVSLDVNNVHHWHVAKNQIGYKAFFTPTKALHGGTWLFISDKLNSCRRSDLESIMNFPKLLESTFAEINQSNRPNVVVGTIYRHHALSPHEFSHNFLLPLLEKINRWGKLLVLLGDFNLNLINSKDNNIHHETKLHHSYKKSVYVIFFRIFLLIDFCGKHY